MIGQAFHLTNCVIAQIAEQAGCNGGQAGGQGQTALINQLAQGLQRLVSAGLERARRNTWRGRQCNLGLVAPATPDQVRIEADRGVATAKRAAFHALQQEGVGVVRGQFEIGRDRRFQVIDARCGQKDRLSAHAQLCRRLKVRGESGHVAPVTEVRCVQEPDRSGPGWSALHKR